jgi:alpha-1,3-rhamnosyl/mannosyltransferase
MARSDLVFAPSATIRNELLGEYHLDPAKVIVASPAADSSAYFPRPAPQCAPVLDEYSLRWRKFILFVGTIEPRKNIERLLDAYGRLSADLRADFPLVLAGGKGWVDDAIYRKLQDLRREGLDLRLLGYVPLERLPFLYSSCAVFAFPSLYEGFGMPLLEAMACGAPAVTSSISSLPEVAGDAGILVDPFDTGAIAAGIELVLRDGELAERMRAAGLRQAGKFSWEASAEVVLAAMESILDGPGKGTAKR